MTSFGTPPKAEEFASGAMWLVMECPAPDVAPLVWQVHAYAYTPCRVDWGDGTQYVAVPQEYAPSGSAPGLYTASHTFASPGPYRVKAFTSTGMSIDMIIQAGATLPGARDFSDYKKAVERDLKQATATGRLG